MLINRESLRTLTTGYTALFNLAFESTESHLDKLATIVPSTSAEDDHSWLGALPSMREWIGQRHVNNVEAFVYTIKNRTFESTFAVGREDIEDDKIGLYGPMARHLGEMSKTHPDELIFSLMKNGVTQKCFDGQYFFDTDHPVGDASVSNMQAGTEPAWFLFDTGRLVKPFVFQRRRDYKFTAMDQDENVNVFMNNEYVYGVDARVNAGYGLWQFAHGSKAELNAANYAAARAAMRGMKSEAGRPLLVSPNLLVVPPELEDTARRLLVGQQDAAGASNIYAGTAELVVSSWLT